MSPPIHENPTSRGISRRHMLQTSALAAAGLPFLIHSRARSAEQKPRLFSAMGIATGLDRAKSMQSAGADFLTISTSELLVPDQDEATFSMRLETLAKSPLPVLACNGFIRPAHLRCVGKDANHDEVLAWAATVCRRLNQANGKFIVFGSANARTVRDDWPIAKAEKQFVSLLKRLGPLAEQHDVTVVVEQLQESECNFINHIADAARLIRQAEHPKIRVLADLYHMMKGHDTPEDLKAAMDVVVHVEIAELADRTVPGVNGDDFRPFFRVLRDAGYHGAISIEGKGTPTQIAHAFATIAEQATDHETHATPG